MSEVVGGRLVVGGEGTEPSKLLEVSGVRCVFGSSVPG